MMDKKMGDAADLGSDGSEESGEADLFNEYADDLFDALKKGDRAGFRAALKSCLESC